MGGGVGVRRRRRKQEQGCSWAGWRWVAAPLFLPLRARHLPDMTKTCSTACPWPPDQKGRTRRSQRLSARQRQSKRREEKLARGPPFFPLFPTPLLLLPTSIAPPLPLVALLLATPHPHTYNYDVRSSTLPRHQVGRRRRRGSDGPRHRLCRRPPRRNPLGPPLRRQPDAARQGRLLLRVAPQK